MQTITATEAKQHFSQLLEKALLSPVVITKQSRDVAVVMSREQYERMRRLNIEEFQEFRRNLSKRVQARGLTEAKLQKMLADD